MIIGIDASHAVINKRTGVAETCRQIIEHLKTAIPSEHHVVLYSPYPPKDELADLPFHWQWKILKWPWNKFWTQGVLARELKKNPPAIFFSPGQILPWHVPSRSFVFLHDSAFLFCPTAYRFWGRQYLRLMNWWVIKKAHTIITSSVFNLNELIRHYGSLVASKVCIVPLAYDDKRYNCDILPFTQAEQQEIFGINKPFVLFVGRLEKKKNIQRLVQIFNHARQQHDFQLVLSGHCGCGWSEINQEIMLSPYRRDIIITGWVAADHLSRLVRTAHVLAFLSVYEGFGLPLLEAMACGVPVLANDIPALREVGGAAVFFTTVNDVDVAARNLIQILTDVHLRARLVTLGTERVSSFSWQKTAREIAKILLV